MPEDWSPTALIADIGATNARFALVGPTGATRVERLICANHPSLASAIGAYLDQVDPRRPPRQAAIAWAGPVSAEEVRLTNHPWSFSKTELRSQLALDRLIVVNDFEAVALALPHITAADRIQVGPGAPKPGHPVAVLGPGTGLGVSTLVYHDGGQGTGQAGGQTSGWKPLRSEGGHVTMPATDDEEAAVLSHLRRRFGHVSAERLLCGTGLVNLYEGLSAVAGEAPALGSDPAAITKAALDGQDAIARRTLEMFCGMLGTVAGNLALTVGSHGGVFVAGGIIPRFADFFAASAFRRRFEDKGRLSTFVRSMPTYLITHPIPAFVGLTALITEDDARSAA